jgi:hypothetical protein
LFCGVIAERINAGLSTFRIDGFDVSLNNPAWSKDATAFAGTGKEVAITGIS